MTIADVLLSILWLALFIYTIFGGADFGAGMLELIGLLGKPGNRGTARGTHSFSLARILHAIV